MARKVASTPQKHAAANVAFSIGMLLLDFNLPKLRFCVRGKSNSLTQRAPFDIAPRSWPYRAIDVASNFTVKSSNAVAVVVPGEVCGSKGQPRQKCAEVCHVPIIGAG